MNKTIRCICPCDPYWEKFAPNCIDISGSVLWYEVVVRSDLEIPETHLS